MVKRVVVTGASRGIGRAVAEHFASRGATLTLLGRPSPQLREVEDGLRARGAFEVSHPVELSDPDSVHAAVKELSAAGTFSAIVHAAGIVERSPLLQLDPLGLRRQFEVNTLAPLELTRAVLPAMLLARSGRILFVSSISAGSPTAHQVAYNASKAAVTMAMRCLALELSDSGVMTAAVLPGAVDTDMLKGSPYAARMSAEDVAKTLAFLAFDASLAHNGAAFEMFGT